MGVQEMNFTPHSDAEIEKQLNALPLVEYNSHLLDEKGVNFAMYFLDTFHSKINEHIHDQVVLIAEEIGSQLDTTIDDQHFIVNKNELRGIIARAAIAATAQTAVDLGITMLDSTIPGENVT
ncbi:MAG: hypothetical protein NVSMB46_05660 [Candidatus Saccharimonadales bacterium]